LNAEKFLTTNLLFKRVSGKERLVSIEDIVKLADV